MVKPFLHRVLLKKMNLEHLPFGEGAEQQVEQGLDDDSWWKGLIGNVCFKPMDDTCSEFQDSLQTEAGRMQYKLYLRSESVSTTKMQPILKEVNAIACQVSDDADVRLAQNLTFHALEIYLRETQFVTEEEINTRENDLLIFKHIKPLTSVKLIADRSFYADPKGFSKSSWVNRSEKPVFITNFEHPRTELTGIDACQEKESLRIKLEQLQQEAQDVKLTKPSTNDEEKEGKINWTKLYRSGISPGSTGEEISQRLNALFSHELFGANRTESNDANRTLSSVARMIFNCLHTSTGCGALYNHNGLITFRVRQELVLKTLTFIKHSEKKSEETIMDVDKENCNGENVGETCPYDDWNTETDDELLNSEEPGQFVITDVKHFNGYSHKIRKVYQNTVYVSGLMQCDKGLGVIFPLVAFIKRLDREAQRLAQSSDNERLVDQFGRMLRHFNIIVKRRRELNEKEASFPIHNLNPGCPFEYVDVTRLQRLVTNSVPVITNNENNHMFIGKWAGKRVILKVFCVNSETSYEDMKNESKMYRYIYRTAGDLFGTILPRIIAMTKHYVGPALYRDVLVTEIVGEEIKYDDKHGEHFIVKNNCKYDQVIDSAGRMLILKAALKSLCALHARGIVHKSIELRNMRVEGFPVYEDEIEEDDDIDCKVWWGDLGKAKLIDGDQCWREMVNEGLKLARILNVQLEMTDNEIFGMIMANAKI